MYRTPSPVAQRPALHRQCDRRVEMAARDMTYGIRHRQNRQAEGQRDADKADPEIGKTRGQDRGPASTKCEPECAKELGYASSRQIITHSMPPLRQSGR